ncbi:MAG TPA: hypothetical protein VJC03_03065, partial [bacterium]|nr:hypothetical protein [bacterium]
NPTLNLVNGTAYDISVYNSSGTVITSPLTRHATIYFTYDANQFAGREDDLFILKYSSGSWSSTDSVVDKSNHQVKLMTDTFSTFVLAIRQSPALRIIDGLKVYPNPFNPNNQDITLSYVAAESGELEARIFTVTGELVKKWKFRVSGDPSGLIPNTFIWDGKNGGGMICANGTYLLSLKLKTDAGREKEIRSKIVILK